MFSFFKRLKAVRGAVFTDNTPEQIKEDVIALYSEIINKNKIKEKDIVSVQFSLTSDLTSCNPATALRSIGLLSNTALFTSLEPCIDGSKKGVIRILMLYYGKGKPCYVYQKGAEILRKL